MQRIRIYVYNYSSSKFSNLATFLKYLFLILMILMLTNLGPTYKIMNQSKSTQLIINILLF